MLISYRRFGTNHHYSLRNKPKERSSHLLRGRSLKSRIAHLYWEATLRFVQKFETYQYVVPKQQQEIITTR